MQTQQRMSMATSPAPFFLPVQQQTSASSYFSVSSTSSVAKQQKRSQQRGQSSTTNSYFKTSETTQSKKQKETELESQSSNRLTALHSSLQHEAEKIRKWKNSTELELKNKEKCLNEANCTIENQRKSLTDLQLKNESLQSKLNDEITNQKELRRKIASTREMCTALKNHCIKIDASIMKGQEDRDHLMLLNEERLLNYQELLDRYHQLEEGQNEWHKKYESTLAAERKKLAEMEDRHSVTSQQLEEATCKTSSFEQQSIEDKQRILSLTEEMAAKSLQYNAIRKEKGEVVAALALRGESLVKLEEQTHELMRTLSSMKQQLTQCKTQLDQTHAKMESNEESYSAKISELEGSLACETEKCDDLLKTKADLESHLEETTTELEVKCQALSKDLEDKIRELGQANAHGKSQEAELVSLKSCRDELQGAKSELQLNIQKLEGEVLALKEDLDQQIVEKEKGLQKAENLISDVVSRHEGVRECWKEKEKALNQQLEGIQSEKEGVTCELNSLSLQFEELKADFEKQMKINNEQATKQESCVEDLKVEKGSLAEENTNLNKEIQILSENKEKLTARCSKMEQVQSINKKLQTNLEEKISLSEDLRTQILQLETAVSIKDKEQNLLIEQLRNEVSASNSRESDTKKSHALEVAELKEGLRAQARELISQLENSKKEAEDVRKELHQEKESCLRKVEDLAGALDAYRSERETAMAAKDKVIGNLTEQLEESKKSKEETVSKLSACEDEIVTLHSEINAKGDELKQLLKSVEAVCNKQAPAVSSTPMRKTPQTKSALTRFKSTQLPPGPVCTEVSSTPHVSSDNVSSAAISEPRHLPRPSSTSRRPKPAVPSTPTRLYNYSMTATPQYRNKLSSTPRYTSRPKRMRCEPITSPEGAAAQRENTAYAQRDEDEAVFKKPKAKDVSVIIQKASSTTRPKKQTKPKTATRGKKPSNTTSASTDMSWFDVDAVYGFGTADYD